VVTTTFDFSRQRQAAQAFRERFQQLRDQGQKPLVISRSHHPEQWRAWETYYRAKGLMASVDLMHDGRSEITVPCLNPHDFELPEVAADRRVKD
jgi:hypothetical protein